MLPALLLACLASGSTENFPVFDQPVEISLELANFKAEEGGKIARALLFGSIAKGANISVLCEENDPFFAGTDCLEKWKGATAFNVGDVPCVQATDKLGGGVYKSIVYHAYVATPDYLYDIHVSAGALKGKGAAFTREDFSAIVKSFTVTGRPRTEDRRLPDAYYALRDEAAKHPKDQLDWVRAYCKQHPEDPLAHLYLARLLGQKGQADLAAAEFVLAADGLATLTERTEQQTNGLLEALDHAAAFQAGKKAWKATIPLCERIVQATESAAWPRAQRFRGLALYHLAIAHAQSKYADQALEYLRLAIELEPARKTQSQQDELFGPLHDDPRFKKLTGA